MINVNCRFDPESSNKRHNRAGHLFQGRFKAILVDADPYAGELSRYIHLNPVRAGIIREPEKYLWSSYLAYIGKTAPPKWLAAGWLLHYFGEKASDARKAYRFFVEAAIGKTKDPLKGAAAGLILGRDEFVEDIRVKYLGSKRKGRDVPSLRELTKASIERIIEDAGKRKKKGVKPTIYILEWG